MLDTTSDSSDSSTTNGTLEVRLNKEGKKMGHIFIDTARFVSTSVAWPILEHGSV